MYRTGDPRFRRRLDEIGQTLEAATETAQSNLYIFGQTYIRPCLESVGSAIHSCVDASCPQLNLSARDRERARRQQGRRRGRAELAFDFYAEDWDDEDEPDPFGGSWGGNEEFDRLLSSNQGYGTLGSTTAKQPARQRGMSYPKGRRKSALDNEVDPTLIPGSSGFIARLFGGKTKNLRYKPSAADLQEHPGARRLGRDLTEGEALLADEGVEGGKRKHRRTRSSTVTSGHTTDSRSSRGDIFPSDEELDDAIPLDDEFAMVLERRTTQSGPETESSSQRTRGSGERPKRGKRPSAGSRRSTQSSRSRKRRSRTNSSAAQTPIDERPDHDFERTEDASDEEDEQPEPPTISEIKAEDTALAAQEEADVSRRREEAQKLAAERGLIDPPLEAPVEMTEGEVEQTPPPHAKSPMLQPVQRSDEPSQLPTPLGTDDEAEVQRPGSGKKDGGDANASDG